MSAAVEKSSFECSRGMSWSDQASSAGLIMGVIALGLAVLTLLVGIQAALTGEPLATSWYRNLSLALWFTLLPIPGQAWAALQAQRKVWESRVAPAQGVRSVVRSFWITLGAMGSVTVLPLLALVSLAPPPAGVGPAVLLVIGLMGGALSASVVVAAAWRGELPAVWLLPAMAVQVIMPVLVFPEAHWASWQAAEGFRAAVLAVLAVSPAGTLALLRPLVALQLVTRCHDVTQALRTTPRQWFRSLTERLHYVDGATSLMLTAGAWGQLPQQFINRQPEGLVFMPWGSTFTIAGPWRLLCFALFASFLLMTPALHWRNLLAPTGAFRTQLGPKIWMTTYLSVVGILFLSLTPVGLGVLVLSDDSADLWPRVPELLLNYVPPLLLDLALATALAALIRGWAGSQGRTVMVLVSLALLWGLVHLSIAVWTGQGKLVLMQRDGSYALLSLVATACCVWGATRTWSRADLGELLRRSRKPSTHSEDLWSWRSRR
jgi:hypothetical protein